MTVNFTPNNMPKKRTLTPVLDRAPETGNVMTREMPAETETDTYRWRNLTAPNDNSPVDQTWHVAGVHTREDGKSTYGILEWCFSREDAENMLKKMRQFKEFSELQVDNCPND